MRAHCINLDHRPERWRTAEPALRVAGFAPQRFSAVSVSDVQARAMVPHALTQEAYARLGRVRETHEELGSLGAVGCYLSHATLWQRLLESGEPSAYIFEDDIAHVDPTVHAWVARAPSDYDLLVFHYHARTPPKPINDTTVQLGRFFFLNGYVISRKGAQNMLSKCFPISEQVDSFISRNELGLQVYAPKKSLLTTKDYGTDIQTPLALPFTYRLTDDASRLNNRERVTLGLCVIFYISAFILLGYKLARH